MAKERIALLLSEAEFRDRCYEAIWRKFPVEAWGTDHTGALRRVVFYPSLNLEDLEIEGRSAQLTCGDDDIFVRVDRNGTPYLYRYIHETDWIRLRRNRRR